MATIEHQMTEIYCCLDDAVRTNPNSAWRRSNNTEPVIADAEVLAMGLMWGCLRAAGLKKTSVLMAENSPCPGRGEPTGRSPRKFLPSRSTEITTSPSQHVQ